MRHHWLILACALAAFTYSTRTAADLEQPAAPCQVRPAQLAQQSVTWHQGNSADTAEQNRWCRAVGLPVLRANPDLTQAPPPLESVMVATWNAHLAEGSLSDFVRALRTGAVTGGTPVMHFVLLIQEAYRRGAAVPPFPDDARTAFGIVPRDPNGPDSLAEAAALGLAVWYVPSMRNGREMHEDRGNAIVSTEPLLAPRALELPLARQRRVAVGATIAVQTARGREHIHAWSAHLEPVSSPKTLWLFYNPRPQQARAILSTLASPAFAPSAGSAGVVLGGDFNTVRAGDREDAYGLVRQWSTSLDSEDRRRTHVMGRLDYLFFKLASGWVAQTRRLDERFGSDHYPVAGQFVPSR